jgi:hypothetical protein
VRKGSYRFIILEIKFCGELISIHKRTTAAAVGFAFGSVILNVVGLASVWAL